ncbi:PREDICTED: uncharacterized protein LOC109209040 [Nicotiana attenuata]|uniref:uncharacterized protein LOC109209040 n=1 Tax=Nicotiana attenuata TaxID=49451 RepID=UPI0009058DA8|nr:PREDICTED: uncharacterized protein LOC109209040 [Nicotiana attenuata]
MVVDQIVGASQSAFIAGRSILDNVIVAHELVKGYTQKGISPRCIIKMDIKKAYDSVADRIFIQLMIQAFNHFSSVSGLKANMKKSSLYISGVSQVLKAQILNEIQFALGQLAFKYLGIPLSSKKITIQ